MSDESFHEKWERAFVVQSRTEREMVRGLGAQIGFGRIMQLCEELWRERLIEKGNPAGGEFSVGTCVAFLVPCPHTIKDDNGHCDICCGSGRITKGVAKLLETAA